MLDPEELGRVGARPVPVPARVLRAGASLSYLDGIREGAGLQTPPLEPGGAGPGRIRELASGMGGANRLSTPGRPRTPAEHPAGDARSIFSTV